MKAYLRLIRYLYPYWGVIALTWVASLLILGLHGLSIWIGAEFIEKILLGPSMRQAENVNSITAIFDGVVRGILARPTPFQTLVTGIGALVFCLLAIAVLRILKHISFAIINQSILLQIRNEMFEKLTHMDLSFSEKNRPGEISSLVIRDTSQLNYALIDVADRLFMQPLRLIFAVILMLSLSWKLTCWILPFIFLSGIIVHYAGRKIELLAKNVVERIAAIQGNLTEYISTVVIARAFNKEVYERERFAKACADLKKTNIMYMLMGAVTPQVIQLFFLIAGGILLLIGGNEVLLRKSMPGASLVKMTLLLPMATNPVKSLASLYISIRTSIASAKRVFNLIDETGMDIDVSNTVIAKPLSKSIVFDQVGYAVNGMQIIADLNVTIPRGATIVIVGPSGVGKTTMLSLIARFAVCTSGIISVDGIDLKRLDGTSWRRFLGIVPQVPMLINGTIRENFRYACPDADESQMKGALGEVLLWEGTCAFSQGLDTMVGNRGDMISGGERQRVTIARALLHNPDILLMDEPVSMLDYKSRSKILETIERVSKGRTVIISTHDDELRKIADMEIVLERKH